MAATAAKQKKGERCMGHSLVASSLFSLNPRNLQATPRDQTTYDYVGRRTKEASHR